MGPPLTTCSSRHNLNDHDYADFIRRLTDRLICTTNHGQEPLFRTSGCNLLWDAYLGSFDDPDERQYHNCSACRRFILEYGGLAVINEDGEIRSAIWDPKDAPERYRRAVTAMADVVAREWITTPFLSSKPIWGQPEAGGWQHLHLTPPPTLVMKAGALTAGQAMAAKREDYRTVQRALGEFSAQDLELAVSILRSDTLYRSEKVLGAAEWLRDLHQARSAALRGRASSVVWRAVAKAPSGFCHPRSSMIGTLLDDLAAGKSIDAASKAFAEKMHPLRYQRPQAAPSEGTIAQAEKMVEKLGIQRSLERRHITGAHELKTLWLPRRAEDQQRPSSVAKPVFGGLRAKGARSPEKAIVPGTTPITWAKFYDTVLPDALGISFLAPAHGHGYCGLLTAVHADAPPILRWDSLEARNTVSWYVRSNGRSARSMGLIPDAWTTVTALSFTPPMWATGTSHDYVGVIFLLDGAREMEKTQSNLFPEILRFELHGVRSVIEAHSKQTQLAPSDHPGSAGWVFFRSHGASVNVRVTRTSGLVQEYRIDRWD